MNVSLVRTNVIIQSTSLEWAVRTGRGAFPAMQGLTNHLLGLFSRVSVCPICPINKVLLRNAPINAEIVCSAGFKEYKKTSKYLGLCSQSHIKKNRTCSSISDHNQKFSHIPKQIKPRIPQHNPTYHISPLHITNNSYMSQHKTAYPKLFFHPILMSLIVQYT